MNDSLTYRVILQCRAQQTFSVKGQIVNILGFKGHGSLLQLVNSVVVGKQP